MNFIIGFLFISSLVDFLIMVIIWISAVPRHRKLSSFIKENHPETYTYIYLDARMGLRDPISNWIVWLRWLFDNNESDTTFREYKREFADSVKLFLACWLFMMIDIEIIARLTS